MPLPPATSPSGRVAGNDSWDRQLAPFIAAASAPTGRPATWRDFCDRLHINLLQRWLPPTTTGRALKTDLFDEAAGEGLSEFLAQRADQVVGTDVSLAVARAATGAPTGAATGAPTGAATGATTGAATGATTGAVDRPTRRVDVTLCDVRRLAFADGSFDIVVSNSTLDHFALRSDITVALAEIHRVTRPGGVLVVTLDNPRHPLVAARTLLPARLLRALGLQPYYVGATMSLPRLVATLESLGWVVDDTTTMMHTLRVAAIPACSRLDRVGPGGTAARRRLTAVMLASELLGRLPTRQFTGHYVAVKAVRA
jgi:SAM-dependent methyltransferase